MKTEESFLPKRSLVDKLGAKFRITPNNIAYFVYPLVQFIHTEKPDYVVTLDTGGRLTGFATYMLYKELYGQFPTTDGLIHFKRIGHSFSQDQVRNQLKTAVENIMTTSQSPTVLFIDDWVNSGRTSLMVRQACAELSRSKIRVKIGVMREFLTGIADVKGDTFSVAQTSWHHKPGLIGIEYPTTLTSQVIRLQGAIPLREKISQSIKIFAKSIKENDIN